MSDSSEAVALRLLEMLMQHEQLAAEFKEKPGASARNWLLNSYGECLRSVLAGKERAEGRFGGGRGRGADGAPGLRRGPPAAATDED